MGVPYDLMFGTHQTTARASREKAAPVHLFSESKQSRALRKLSEGAALIPGCRGTRKHSSEWPLSPSAPT